MRHVRPTLLSLLITLLALPGRLMAAPDRPAPVDFARDVRPILEARCYPCHGPTRQRSGLRLDTRAGALKGGDSPLVQLVSGEDEGLRMPPKGQGLSAAEVATLRRWIDQGASWPEELGRESPAGPR